MCIILNYCPRNVALSGKNSVEKKTIRAAYHFFKGSSMIEELFAQVELQLQFPEEQQDTEILLVKAITNFESSMDYISESIQLANTLGIDKTAEDNAKKILDTASEKIKDLRPFTNIELLEPLLKNQLLEATDAQRLGGSQSVLQRALYKLGNLTDTLSNMKGETRKIESMTGVFATITKQISEYKVFSFVVSQTYKAIKNT